MSLITLQYVFAAGNTIIASQHNTNNSTIYNMFNGGIDTTNLSPTANITGSQLSPTAGIVGTQLASNAAIAGTQITSISATQLTGLLPSSLVSGTKGSNYYVLANGTSLTTNQVVQAFVPNNIQIFTSSTTWTWTGQSNVYVKVAGNGGAAGTGTSSGGGGAGGYSEGIIPVTGNVLVVMGATNNSFSGGKVIFATFGGVGGNGNGTTTTGAGGSGGAGSGGIINITGQIGTPGSVVTASPQVGTGGVTPLGTIGGGGGASSAAAGSNGAIIIYS